MLSRFSSPLLRQNRRRVWLVAGIFIGGLAFYNGTLHLHKASAAPATASPSLSERPRYDVNLHMDWQLLSLAATAKIEVPADASDPLSDASFFLYANSNGVGGASATQLNLVVDDVLVNGQKANWKLEGPVLKVKFPTPQSADVPVEVRYHGLVPRSQAETGMMGGLMGSDISGLLGGMMGGGQTAPAKTEPRNTDYGLYTATPTITSLGSFWCPTLAVRQNGHWVDAAPDGLGDVAYAEKSDYSVRLNAPQDVVVVAPGTVSRAGEAVTIQADDVRDCAVLASRGFESKSKTIRIGDHDVVVSAYALKEHAGRLNECVDIAANALQIYSKRFGAYPFSEFKLVEAPMKNGAGGMEYSRMVGIASSLYEPMGKQLSGMISSLNLPGTDQLLGSLGDDGGGATGKAPAETGNSTDAISGLLGQQKAALDSIFEVSIAHEVGHQWWAIGVGSDSQRDPWVDESLTNWCAMLYFEDRYGKQKADEMREMHLKTTYSMGAALGGGDKPADLPTSAYANNLQYGAVVYGKAALFYDHLRSLVGDEAFFASLREYYARYNDHLANSHSLREIVEAHSNGKKAAIEALYKRWIEEAHGGEDIGAGAAGDISSMLGNLFGGTATTGTGEE